MKILAIGDPHGKLPKNLDFVTKKNKIDLILCVGDAGKADLARKRFFENIERKKKGLPELEYNNDFQKKVWMEIYNSSLYVWKYLSKLAPTYSVLGNVGTNMIYDWKVKKEERKYGLKLPSMRSGMNKIKDFHFVRNVVRNVDGMRIGFLEYFTDTCWVKEFKPADYSKKLKNAKKETEKARRILKNFGKIDILVCHQPPYGYLDKVNNSAAPKDWKGKHAGSKVILDYVKKYQPKVVLCGHIHEAKGEAKIGKTKVYNLGWHGNYKVIDLNK